MAGGSGAPSVATRVIDTVADEAAIIRAELSARQGALNAENPSGEQQLAAEVWADAHLIDRLGALDGVGILASEERDDLIDTGSGVAVTIDPLDGSSNFTSNTLLGTIVGIYDDSLPTTGRSLVGAAYVLYGPKTTMVGAVEGEPVTERIISTESNQLLNQSMQLPDSPTVYGLGGRVPDWPAPFAAFVEEIESELKLRYGDAFVGDVNQVLHYGGIFAYPALRSRPSGTLRVLFKANPIAYLIERAGGASSDGAGSLLDRSAGDIHARTPVYVGNTSIIDRLESALAE